MTNQISYTNHCILINTSDIFCFSQQIESINGIKDFQICKIDWDRLKLKNNLNRLIRIFKSEKYFNYDNKDNLYLLFVKVVNNDVKILIDHNNVLHASEGLIQLIDIIKSKLSKCKYCLTSSSLQSNAIKTLFNLNDNINNETIISLNDDLLGSNSWTSLSFLFKFLNISSNWLIIRNFEELSDSYIFKSGDDIDILCDDLQYFTALMNAKKRHGGRCSYFFELKNQKIPLDIRFVGDKYFDPIWASDMLKRKSTYNNIPTLSNYDYFFSLIYHSKLQKKEVKKVYIHRLEELSNNLHFNNLPSDFILDDQICSELLNGFLYSNNYRYTFTDDAVRNEDFLKHIKFKEINDHLSNWRLLIKRTPLVVFNKLIEVGIRILGKNKKHPKIYSL